MTLNNGEDVTLTLNHGLIYKLESVKPEAYKRYYRANNEIMNKGFTGDKDYIFELLDVIYMGYLCGMLKDEKLDEALDYEDFLMECPEGDTEIVSIGTELISPKKKRDSGRLSIPTTEAKTK